MRAARTNDEDKRPLAAAQTGAPPVLQSPAPTWRNDSHEITLVSLKTIDSLFPRLPFFKEPAPADDETLTLHVDLEDLALDGLADQGIEIRRPCVDLAGGQENLEADVEQQTGLEALDHDPGDRVAFGVLRDNALPHYLALVVVVIHA